MDEMKVKEDLVYDKKTGKLVGFTSLGDINDNLTKLENDINSSNEDYQPPISDHILVLMVRGLFFNLTFPYAHFPTNGIVADKMFTIVWDAIEQLEIIGFKVISVTADGASPNRKFFHMHSVQATALHKTTNPYASASENRSLFFISDTPHLIKTTRNCWAHSGFNGTRLMKVRTCPLYCAN